MLVFSVMKQRLIKALKIIGMVLYAPLYIAFWLLHKAARILLAIAYIGILEPRMAYDIILHLLRFERWSRS